MNLQNLAPISELYVSYESAQKLKLDAADLTSWDLTPRQICDLELLMNLDRWDHQCCDPVSSCSA